MTINFTDQIRAAKEAKTLNKPFRTPGGPKKFSVYTKNEKGNVVKVNFGDPNMKIKRSDPARRKSFRARHGCDKAPGPKWKAKYWSCQQWRAGAPVQGSENTIVSLEAEAGKGLWYNIQKKKERMGKNYKAAKPGDKDYPKQDALKKAQAEEWDGQTFWDQTELLKICPELSKAEEVEMESEEQEFEEYKSDFLGMSIGSLRSIQNNVNAILANLENENTKENLTESWLQGKIAVTEDYMIMIHNYVMFNQEDDYSNASEDGEMEDEEDEDEYENGSMVRNINPSCDHYGSEGVVESVEQLPNRMGKVVKYKVTNDGPNYKKGDILTKTKDQLIRSRASYESDQEYQSVYQTEGKNFKQFLQKCIPSKDGSDKEKFQSCLLDYKRGQSTKAKLFQPELMLDKETTKLVNETYKKVVAPSIHKDKEKRVGPFTEDDMEFQLKYEKTVHPDYPIKSPITKDQIFTPKELNKDLKPYTGDSIR